MVGTLCDLFLRPLWPTVRIKNMTMTSVWMEFLWKLMNGLNVSPSRLVLGFHRQGSKKTLFLFKQKELGFREVKWLNEGHSVRGDSSTRHLIYLTPTSRCLPLRAHLLALCLCRGQAEVGTGEDLGFPEYRNCGYITLIVYRHILI